jgi:hypothetical protein
VLGQVVQGHRDRFAGCAVGQLGGPRGEAALADRDAEGDADQLGVAELHAHPVGPVIDDHVYPGAQQRLVGPLPRFGDHGVVLLRDDDDRLERRDRDRPDDALVVVVHLDARGHRALHADAVTAHDRLDRLAFRAEHGQLHRVGILVAELEDVPDLDALDHRQRVAAADAGLAFLGGAQVGPLADVDVAGDVHAAQVHVVGVRPGRHA